MGKNSAGIIVVMSAVSMLVRLGVRVGRRCGCNVFGMFGNS